MRGKFPRQAPRVVRIHPSFNEARALCAGSSRLLQFHGVVPCTFNEARALCAGSWPKAVAAARRPLPSMRPAHYAREVRTTSFPRTHGPSSFNEARALCAGS